MHVMRTRSYADSSLVVGAEVCEVFEMTKHQGESESVDVISIGKDPERVGKYRVQIAWVGLEDEEPNVGTDVNCLCRRSQVPRAEAAEDGLNSATKRA